MNQELLARQSAELDRAQRLRLAPYHIRLADARHDFAIATAKTAELAGVTWFYILTPDGAVALANGWEHPAVRNTFLDKYAFVNGYYFIADDAVVCLRGSVAWSRGLADSYGLGYVYAHFVVPL